MATNYADTISMYYDFPTKYTGYIKFPLPWRYNSNSNNSYLHHWFLQMDKLYLSFYPDMFGTARLFVSFSLPRLVQGANTYHVKNFDEIGCYSIIQEQLKIFPWHLSGNVPPKSFTEWQCSRIDLFIMHKIPAVSYKDYMDTYSLLTLPRYRNVHYENTCYINSSFRPDKKSNKLFRMYPKSKEIQRRITGESYYPKDIHKMHEFYLETDDFVMDYYRFELMLRRQSIIYECKKYRIKPTMHDVLSEDFQQNVLLTIIKRVGLDLNMLCKREYVRTVNLIFTSQKTKDNAKLLARLLRNHDTATIKKHFTTNQISYIRQQLKLHGIHIATNRYINLKPVIFP